MKTPAQNVQYIMADEKFVWSSKQIQTSWILSCKPTETVCTSKMMKLIWICQNTKWFWQDEFIFWVTLTYSTSGALYWMRQLFIIKTNSVKIGCSLSNEHYRLYLGLKMSIEHNSVRRNFLLSASFCWDSRVSFLEMNQKFKIGRTKYFGDSYLEFSFCHFKVFKLHAKLNDAAVAMRSHSGRVPGYCYVYGREPNSCLLGYLTGILFCF